MNESDKVFSLYPIGYVKRQKDGFFLKIKEEYIPALKELQEFSHVLVFWWADKNDTAEQRKQLQCTPPYGDNPPVTGVFATRAEYRPNPIALTAAEILEVNSEKGYVKVKNIDAFDNTPIIDLKAYFPVCDRIKNAKIPSWIKGWPEWFPEEGMEFLENKRKPFVII